MMFVHALDVSTRSIARRSTQRFRACVSTGSETSVGLFGTAATESGGKTSMLKMSVFRSAYIPVLLASMPVMLASTTASPLSPLLAVACVKVFVPPPAGLKGSSPMTVGLSWSSGRALVAPLERTSAELASTLSSVRSGFAAMLMLAKRSCSPVAMSRTVRL